MKMGSPHAIRARSLQAIETEFAKGVVRVLDTQMHERDAFRAIFSFGGSLSDLDRSQVGNVPAAIANARAFATEVLSILKPAGVPEKQHDPGTLLLGSVHDSPSAR